ncbi:hypothetical protein FKW50_06810 [Acetobacter pomorum]|uniref:hypothetical protein n=1 Tax=Acetobacter pomorum TaxID=65959 RepID=UPI001279380E|nr:hypothetical protein [Acetobacter pomorum]KAA8419972.1 hypothetical protein FKW54_14470 [Acetobacter pomorum]KAA8435526.1 hypothetical protein FKW50_06810 [Acetobacter pomorum]KAA8448341.1 hypothetical protein FKW52_13645 [Acetobacter pomorum]
MSQSMTMGGYPDGMQFGRSAPAGSPYNTDGYTETERLALRDQTALESWQEKLDALVKEGRNLMGCGLHFSKELPCFGDILDEMEGFSGELDKHDLAFLIEKQP